MADAAKKKSSVKGAKHTLCRRVGYCLWGKANCPTNSRTIKDKNGNDVQSKERAYPAGQHGPTKRRGKLSTYGELLLEKQKLRAYYDISERQLHFLYVEAKKGNSVTGTKLMQFLEMRLMTAVYRAGLAPTIFAARQAVSHGHILVNGKRVNRPSYRLKPGQVISIDEEKSPVIAEIAKGNDALVPAFYEREKGSCKATYLHEPTAEEIQNNIDITKVIEYYAR